MSSLSLQPDVCSALAEPKALWVSEGRKCVPVGLWVAMDTSRKGTTSSHFHCGSSSLVPSLQAPCDLKVGHLQGPPSFYPGACLCPSAIHGTLAVGATGHLQASAKLPSAPHQLVPMLIGAQSPEGTEVAGGWHISTALSIYTPGQAVTEPWLSPEFALRLK